MDHIAYLSDLFKAHFGWHRARTNLLAVMIIALIRVKTVNLVEISSVFMGDAQQPSHYKRLQRFLRLANVDYARVAKLIVAIMGIEGQPWDLIYDRTNWKVGKRSINLLFLGVSHRGAAIPLLWTPLDKQGNSNTKERIELLERFLQIFGKDPIRSFMGDREFIGKQWFQYLIAKGLLLRVRIKEDAHITNAKGKPVPARHLLRFLRPGEYTILSGQRGLWGHRLHIIGCRLEDGKYLILVTQAEPETALEDYARRWEIETFFGCLKTRGFCLEATHVTKPDRVSRLVAVLAIAFCWCHILGEWLDQQKPIGLKTHGRLARSVFRYGFDWLRNIVTNLHDKAVEFQRALQSLTAPPRAMRWVSVAFGGLAQTLGGEA